LLPFIGWQTISFKKLEFTKHSQIVDKLVLSFNFERRSQRMDIAIIIVSRVIKIAVVMGEIKLLNKNLKSYSF